jgi:tRNA(fMet)-specific endonuclease VapC
VYHPHPDAGDQSAPAFAKSQSRFAGAARRFGATAANLVSRGVPTLQMDALIASHALALGATLVTNNTKHFSRVEGLTLENWI